jgi:hypothetical protein
LPIHVHDVDLYHSVGRPASDSKVEPGSKQQTIG